MNFHAHIPPAPAGDPAAEPPLVSANELAGILAKGHIPMRHRTTKATYSVPQWASAMSRLREVSRNRDFMVALVGPRGTGKTQAAIEVAREWAAQGRGVLYLTAMDFFLRVKETFNGESSERAVVGSISNSPLLILDEVQVRTASDWETNLLTNLIDMRYRKGVATVFVTNLRAEQFVAHVGDSIASRIQQTGGIIVFDGPSFRSDRSS